jgi:tRNA threonylcarbamoyladenosine biosynthesis protein TsaB
MRILAIDTATEQCSVALRLDEQCWERCVQTPRGHADLILPMVDSVLKEAGVRLQELDGLAYGRGPGAFTGVRIAVGVAQGLALGASLPTVGVSDLAAVAQQVAAAGERVLVCMDARMGEVYWGIFERPVDQLLVIPSAPERVDPPALVRDGAVSRLAGTGFKAYPQLLQAGLPVHEAALPHARDIASLAEPALRAGQGKPPAQAEPVYLRDRVAFAKPPAGS